MKSKTIINNRGNWGNVSLVAVVGGRKGFYFKSLNLKKLLLLKNLKNRGNIIQLQKETAYLSPSCSLLRETMVKIYQKIKVQVKKITLSLHGLHSLHSRLSHKLLGNFWDFPQLFRILATFRIFGNFGLFEVLWSHFLHVLSHIGQFSIDIYSIYSKIQ